MDRRIYIYTLPLLGLGLVLLVACHAGEQSAPAQATATTTRGDWPMYRGNAAMTGHVQASLPAEPKMLWRFRTEAAIRATPAVRDGVAYVPSGDGKVYAIDLRDGSKRWSHDLREGIESSPLLLKDVLVVGGSDGKVYAIDLRTGRPRWTAETGGKVNASPNVATLDDGTVCVLVGSYDGKLYCLDAANGRTRWAYDTENYVNGAAAVLAIAGQPHVVFGGCDSKLRLIDVNSGELVEATDLGSYIPATVAVVDNVVYAASFEARLFALGLPDGSRKWTFRGDKDQPFFASPAVGSGKVIIGGRDGRLRCLRATDGEELWTHEARDAIDSSAVIVTGDEDRVVVGSDDGRLYILDLATGKPAWSYRIGEPITAAPAVAGGLILVGCDDGYLYAFGAQP